MQLRHLGPQCLQAEGRRQAGSEAAEAGLGVEGRGWCLTSQQVGPGHQDGPLLLGELGGVVGSCQPRPEHGGQWREGRGQERPRLVLDWPRSLSHQLTLQHGLHRLPFKLRQSGGVPEAFSKGVAVYLQFGYLEQR